MESKHCESAHLFFKFSNWVFVTVCQTTDHHLKQCLLSIDHCAWQWQQCASCVSRQPFCAVLGCFTPMFVTVLEYFTPIFVTVECSTLVFCDKENLHNASELL